MSIYRAKDFKDAYRVRASSKDIHAMSGRDGRHDITMFVSQKIYNELNVLEKDVLLDVGCGDGTLLRIDSDASKERVGERKGILPTIEEVERLNQLFKSPMAILGTVTQTTLPKEYADKVVCNGVLLLLSGKEEVAEALSELCRITKKGGTVFVGEIPTLDEYTVLNENNLIPQHKSFIERAVIVLKHFGIKEVLIRIINRIKLKINSGIVVHAPPTTYWSSPEEFSELAKTVGLRLKKSFPSSSLAENGSPLVSKTRYDYIFERL